MITLLLELNVTCGQRWIQFELQNIPSRAFAIDGKIYTTIFLWQIIHYQPVWSFVYTRPFSKSVKSVHNQNIWYVQNNHIKTFFFSVRSSPDPTIFKKIAVRSSPDAAKIGISPDPVRSSPDPCSSLVLNNRIRLDSDPETGSCSTLTYMHQRLTESEIFDSDSALASAEYSPTPKSFKVLDSKSCLNSKVIYLKAVAVDTPVDHEIWKLIHTPPVT